jgi:DNA repair ATPase RecN
MLSILGLEDSYVHDGRVLFETMDEDALPKRLRGHKRTLPDFVNVYKQINAPFGQLALDSLKISSAALASDTANDAMYSALQNKIAAFTSQRDSLAAEVATMLNNAAFNDQPFDEVVARQLIAQAQALLHDVSSCAADPVTCAK